MSIGKNDRFFVIFLTCDVRQVMTENLKIEYRRLAFITANTIVGVSKPYKAIYNN